MYQLNGWGVMVTVCVVSIWFPTPRKELNKIDDHLYLNKRVISGSISRLINVDAKPMRFDESSAKTQLLYNNKILNRRNMDKNSLRRKNKSHRNRFSCYHQQCKQGRAKIQVFLVLYCFAYTADDDS